MHNLPNHSVSDTVSRAIQSAGFEAPEWLTITRPEPDFGDYATSVALPLAQGTAESPQDVANRIAAILRQDHQFADVSVAGPGFINIRMSNAWFSTMAQAPVSINQSLHGKRYIIEYSSPNIAKPMHVGHLRTTVLGQTLVNVFRYLGAEVVAWSHPGDWGVQFGKLIVAWQKWGDAPALQKHPIDELLRVYVKFHHEAKDHPELEDEGRAVFKALQAGNQAYHALWEQFSALSREEFDQMYAMLGVKFDQWRGESTYNDQLHALVQNALHAGVAKESDGAVVIPLDDRTIPPVLIQKSDGATLYATADLVSIQTRMLEYHSDEIIYVVGNEQTLHLQQVFAAAAKLAQAGVYGPHVVLPQLTHVSYGFFRLASGKMSTRAGEIIRLEDVINQAIEEAHKMLKEKSPELGDADRHALAKEIGVGAVKYTDLGHDRHTDVVFDWQKMFSLEGNSIVYLLYTNARCNSLLKEASAFYSPKDLAEDVAWSPHERRLLLTLLQQGEAIAKSVRSYDPHHILDHVYQVASAFSRFYNHDPILKSSPNVRARRLRLTKQVQNQLQLLFDWLNISAPERL